MNKHSLDYEFACNNLGHHSIFWTSLTGWTVSTRKALIKHTLVKCSKDEIWDWILLEEMFFFLGHQIQQDFWSIFLRNWKDAIINQITHF